MGKIVVNISKNDGIKSVGSLQVCAERNSGVEPAIHSMHDVYDLEETEAVLIDAENAFNLITRKVMLPWRYNATQHINILSYNCNVR